MLTFIAITLTIFLMVSATAFYVAAEFSSVFARKTRIAQLANHGSRTAEMLLPIMEDRQLLDRYVAASQIGISISSLVMGAYGQNTVAPFLAPLLQKLGFGNMTDALALSISVAGVLIFLTVLQVIMGELLPKSLTLQYPEKVGMTTVIPMKWSVIILRPFIWFFNGSATLLIKLFGVGETAEEHPQVHSPEEIELLVSQSHQGGLLDDQAQQMLRNALRLRELTARQVMAPRTRLTAAPVQSAVTDLIQLSCTQGVTRIPLYQNSIDNIVGFVHLKDLFRLHLQGQQDPKQILREVIYVPEGTPIAKVWARLNKKRRYIAIVLDEYGGTSGVITLEDLIEEIFGEFLDEFDDELPLISSDVEGRIHLRSDLLVSDVNEYLKLNLPDDGSDTLGGLVFDALGRLPKVGDEASIGQPEIAIRVETMEGRRISEVSLKFAGDEFPHISEWEVTWHD